MYEDWEILDAAGFEAMLSRKGAAQTLFALETGLDAVEAAAGLRHLAVRGDVKALLDDTRKLHDWAEAHALRRLANALMELQRCAELEARGQAILQAQSLTRFIAEIVGDDVALLKRALEEAA